MRKMDMRALAAALILTAACGMNGCAVLLLGAGAAGGYAVSRDTVKNQFDLPKDLLFQRSLAAVKPMGQVTLEDARHGQIRAEVSGAYVHITVKPLTKTTVELRVKARKALMPAVDIAQEVYNKIVERL